VLPVGAAGAVGAAFTLMFVTEETQVLSVVLLVLKACDTPGERPAKVTDD
jgi:hypothetical protein